MLGFLFQFLSPRQKRTIQHEVFGVLSLKQGKAGPYWLHEDDSDDDLAISIDTVGGAEPTESQVNFYRDVVVDIDATYDRVSKYLALEHQKMHRKPIAADWLQTFQIGGVHIPLDGNRLLPWEITFECLTDRTGFLYTCHFEKDEVVHVSVDT